MGTNRARVQSNERIDLSDFDYIANTGLNELAQNSGAQFLANPSGQRAWVLDGFAADAPVATQLRITRGRALLSRREGGQVSHGVVTALGELERIVDISTFAVGTYTAYVRFEYIEGDNESRIFWDATGTGSEFAQNIPTRRLANWSVRLELANPGAEWLPVATVDITAGPVINTVTDTRPLYFEGQVDATYASGWSTDGGGVALDRDSDRATNGVKDLQTFTAAMRQCIEDLKGRGLRRWWDPGIGGLNVGFDTDPTEDRVAVGSVATFLSGSGSPRMQLATDAYLERDGDNINFVAHTTDFIRYDRAANEWLHLISNTVEFLVENGGCEVAGGLNVGFFGTPVDDRLAVGDADCFLDNDGTTPALQFDVTDLLRFNRGFSSYEMLIAGTTEFTLMSTGVNINTGGLVVGSGASAPAAGVVQVEGGVTGYAFRTVQTFDHYVAAPFAMIGDAVPTAINPAQGWVHFAQNTFGTFPVAFPPGSRLDRIDIRVEQQSAAGVTTLNLYRKSATATVSSAATVVATVTSLTALAGTTQILSFGPALAETISSDDLYWIGMTTNSDASGVQIGLMEVNLDQVPNLVVQPRGV